jgi:hypothetical protein
MKKIITVLIAAALTAGSAFAQDEIEVFGQMKTGFFVLERDAVGQDGKKDNASFARIHNNDGDAGASEGRLRFGIGFKLGDFGLRAQFFQDNFNRRPNGPGDMSVSWFGAYFLYAYGNFLEEQFKVSAGLLGESPWGSGGSELFKELEYTPGDAPIPGIRFEWKPNFLPGLNLGFVLNRDDDTVPDSAKEKFGDIFLESVVGVSYENDYFAFRFAYRFNRDVDSPAAVVSGAKLLYRVEERILNTVIPGMSVWANGYCIGIGAAGKGSGRGATSYVQHWLYILYDPEYLSVGLNIGYKDEFDDDGKYLEFRPFVFGKFFNNFLNVGVTAGMEMGFTDSSRPPGADVYNFWFIEPQIKLNVSSNFYAAAVYRYTVGKYNIYNTLEQETHWFNLRLCYTF